MGKTHKEQLELAQELEHAKTVVTIGATYQHYKGADKLYQVRGLGFLEATDELCVMYDSLYGERITFLRPLTVWLEMVQWDGETLPRFKKVN